MSERPGGEKGPSLTMVIAGGVGVLVVLAFIAAVPYGARPAPAVPGARLGLGPSDGPAGLVVSVPRCRGERISGVELSGPEGSLWRVTADPGSIDSSYVVGAEPPPLGFTNEVVFDPANPLPEIVEVTVNFAGSALGDERDAGDRARFELSELPTDPDLVLYQQGVVDADEFRGRALATADCARFDRGIGPNDIAFGIAGAVVLVTYGLLVIRWLRTRKGPPPRSL